MGVYVQYGCGLYAPKGWLNYDASPSLVLRKIPLVGKMISKVPFEEGVLFGDICKGLPLKEGSVDAAYCSHTLEHLTLEDCRLAISNTFKMLRPGGVFRMVLPDVRSMATEYLASNEPDAATTFVEAMFMGRRKKAKGISGLLAAYLGHGPHLWMWDYQALSDELQKAQFTAIRRAEFGDSGDTMFEAVEDKLRWVGHYFGIQCSKAG